MRKWWVEGFKENAAGSSIKEGVENGMIDFDEMKKKRVVYEIAGMDQTRLVENRIYKRANDEELHLDVYYPAELREGSPRPAVLFVHGLGPAEIVKNIKNSGQYVS